MKPVIDEFVRHGVKVKTLYVRQHNDLKRFDNYKPYEIKIPEGGNRLDSIVYGVMSTGLWRAMDDVDTVLVQGDTTTALAVALSAFHNGKKVIHLEAGLRTHNKNPWPEEQNRRMISILADLHLCPTSENANNLLYEQPLGWSFVVGNTAIDNLVTYKNKCEYTDKVLVTMHRRENWAKIPEWFSEIEWLANLHTEIEFILPIHPNPDVSRYRYLFDLVSVVDPMSHDGLLSLLVKTKLVITDSGGLQEECSYFNKKCLVCRDVTERPEALDKSSFLVSEPSMLVDVFEAHINNYEIDYTCPFGDGKSAERIYDILKDKI